jgi:hypothetical protein
MLNRKVKSLLIFGLITTLTACSALTEKPLTMLTQNGEWIEVYPTEKDGVYRLASTGEIYQPTPVEKKQSSKAKTVSNQNTQPLRERLRYTAIECVANAQAIVMNDGKQELSKQITLMYDRRTALNFHNWLIRQSKSINNDNELQSFNRKYKEYSNEDYYQRMERAGYCLGIYFLD